VARLPGERSAKPGAVPPRLKRATLGRFGRGQPWRRDLGVVSNVVPRVPTHHEPCIRTITTKQARPAAAIAVGSSRAYLDTRCHGPKTPQDLRCTAFLITISPWQRAVSTVRRLASVGTKFVVLAKFD
jgi:hypothetical protein